LTPQELMELKQTAYDTTVNKLFLMNTYAGSAGRPFYVVYFKGELVDIRVNIRETETDLAEQHTFTVLSKDNNSLCVSYGNKTLHHYVFSSDQYTLSKKFSDLIKIRAQLHQNEYDANVEKGLEIQAAKYRIESAMKLKSFVASF
jgi:hypothetical protein